MELEQRAAHKMEGLTYPILMILETGSCCLVVCPSVSPSKPPQPSFS
jgi:hypothetical protein